MGSVTCELGHVFLWDAHDPVAGLDLLGHQRFGGSHEDDLAGGEPAVKVVHEHGGDEGLAEAGGEADQRVLQQRRLRDPQLVLAERVINGVDPDAARRGVEARLRSGLQRALGLVHRHQHHIIIILLLVFIRSRCGRYRKRLCDILGGGDRFSSTTRSLFFPCICHMRMASLHRISAVCVSECVCVCVCERECVCV